MQSLVALAEQLKKQNKIGFEPVCFQVKNNADLQLFNSIIADYSYIQVNNNIISQIKELVKSRNPSAKFNEDQYHKAITDILGNQQDDFYGNWFYYPWLNTIVHTLPEAEFIEVRTNRNKQKIRTNEQDVLKSKTIGIVGLSVGQSVAITIAMERVCGYIKLADFDELELSNLNRLRAGIHQMGIPKSIIAARQIKELDPYLKVEIFANGLNDANMDDFFSKLDLLVEVCDELSIKVKSRIAAKKLGIPVVMDTNDRGMLDIERFDLDKSLPILHGLISDEEMARIHSFTPEERLSCILKLVSFENTSERLKESMQQIGKTINTWPQLASSVMIGAGSCTDTCRRILLEQTTVSGRFYIDMLSIVP